MLVNPPGADTVILVVGAKPGPEEERANAAYSRNGVAGRYFHGVYMKYVEQRLLRANKQVAWAVTNAVRCMPPKDANVTPAQVKHCRGYLDEDIKQLAASFKQVVVLCTGEPAARSLFGTGLGAAMKKQGAPVTVNGISVRVFSTANPFVLHVDPAVIHYVQDHLQMMVDYVIHGKIPMTWEMPGESADVDMLPGTMFCIDTETYGCVEGFPEQTVFHPRKMVAIDRIPAKDIVTTAAAAWVGPDGMGSRTWVLPEQELNFFEFVQTALRNGHPLLGMNLAFDIKVMRTLGPHWERLLDPKHRWPIRDLSIANFWNSDIRPERSLKDLAPLLRIVSYDKTIPGWKDLSKGERYTSKQEAALLYYCALDAAATLEAYFRLEESTKLRAPGTQRFGDRALSFYSDVLWTVINMDTTGVAFNRKKLVEMETHLSRRMARLAALIPKRYTGTVKQKRMKRKSGDVFKEVQMPACIGGEGSAAWITKVFSEAIDAAGIRGHKDLETTESSAHTQPCTHKNNMNFILGKLPVGHPARKPLEQIRMYRRAEKLVGTYIGPLLHEPARGLDENDIAYPTWYSVPSYEKDGEGHTGGTQQGRFAAKDPAIQTLPKLIKECLDTRFSPGVLTEFDINQAEPRLGTLLSGDPVMLSEFEEDARMRREGLGKLDFHTITAKAIFGEDVQSHPDFTQKRHVAKIVRLLTAYRGGATTLQESLRRGESPIEFPIEKCRAMLSAFDNKYRVYRAWQDQLVLDVSRRGYMELPISADTRTFVKGKEAAEKYVNTVCNFPVQDHAASTLKDAQSWVQLKFWELGMRAVVGLNCHDALYVDCPAEEEAQVRAIVEEILPCPPYYAELQSIVGRTVPLQYEAKVIARR